MCQLRTFGLGLIVLLLPISACQRDAGVWSRSDPTYLPEGAWPSAVSEDNRFVAIVVDPRSDRSTAVGAGALRRYLLDLHTGSHRLLGDADSDLLRISDHSFLYSASQESVVLLFDGLDQQRSFNIGRHVGGWWNGKNSSVIFENAWPDDREGFSGIALLRTRTGEVTTVRLKEPSELLGICAKTGRFYTEHYYSSDNEDGRDEYDGDGNLLSQLRSPRGVYSANCRYVLPFSALNPHGPADWAVFDAASNEMVMDFPQTETGTDSHWFTSWNPRYDNLLLAGVRQEPQTL